MSDVLLQYLIMARRRDLRPYRRLLYVDEPWLGAGVEQLVETAAARVMVTGQYEKVKRWPTAVPASRRDSIRFYEEAEPDRPVEGVFEERWQDFALAPTLEVGTCKPCRGQGETKCNICDGRRNVRCRVCHGSGRLGQNRCNACGGARKVSCGTCRGRGRRTCVTCEREGEAAVFEREIYDWWFEENRTNQYPPDPHPELPRAFDEWLRIDADAVEDLEPPTVAAHLGFETPEALEVAKRAEQDRVQLEEQARNPAEGRCLFLSTVCAVSPVGGRLNELAEALDGLVILEESGSSDPPEDVELFYQRVRELADESFGVTWAQVTSDPDIGLAAGGSALPLEAIRAAFVGSIQEDADWYARFRDLWRPVDRVLAGKRGPSGESSASK